MSESRGARTGREKPRSLSTGPTEIDLTARIPEPVTPVAVEVVSVESDPLTGSLPVFTEAIQAERGRHVERTPAEQRMADLEAELSRIAEWWIGLAKADIDKCMPKAIEYGSGDLEMMGYAVRQLQGDVWDGDDAAERDAIGTELAILFYIQGKISRALAAAKHGRRCSGDTIEDIRIYSVMLTKVRQTGKWV